MNTSTRTAQLFFPASELSTVVRISRGMGWNVVLPDFGGNDSISQKDKEQLLMDCYGAWGDDEDAYTTEDLCADVKKMMNGNDFVNKYM